MAVSINDGSLEFSSSIDLSQFTAQLNRMERGLQDLTQTANQQASSVENYAKKAQIAVASYLSFAAAGNFVRDLVQVRGEFQQLEVAFTTMLQSKEKADKLLQEVTEFAATTPFELKDVAGATKQLLAFGIGADSIKGTLRSLGDISAGIGAPLGEIAYLFGTIKTQGVALTQDVRQFAQRGIPVYEELAKVLGVSTEEVGQFISTGKVGFKEIEQVFKNLTAEGSKFGGLMAEQAKTLTGLQSNLADAWAQMMNEIGKSNEGAFADIIKGATVVVENYQTVIDVLKVLAITYGTYRAALVATAVAQNIATAAAKGYTVAEMLRYRAMVLSEAAMKLLNRTMLANPYVAVATGLAAIVTTLVLLRKESTNVKSSQELLAQAQEKVGSRLAETEAKIRPLVAQLKDLNLTEDQRLTIYNKLRDIDPQIIAGIDKKKTGYQDLTGAVNQYLDSLRKEIALQTNKEALTESIKGEQTLQKQIEETRKRYLEFDKSVQSISRTGGQAGQALEGLLKARRAAGKELDQLKAELQQQQKVSEEINATINTATTPPPSDGAKPRTLQVIEDAIKLKREEQAQNATTSQEYKKYQEEINALEAERREIIGASKKEISAANALEDKTNSLLEKRLDLLQDIQDLVSESKVGALTEEQREIDRINEKYDAAFKKISDFNSQVQVFNARNRTNVQQIGQVDIQALNDARQQELKNVDLKKQAENFKTSLEEQKAIFERYEEAKKQIGIQKADELFAEQRKGFASYTEFLKSEAAKIAPKFVFGIANLADTEKLRAITKQLQEAEKANETQLLQERIANVQRLFNVSATVSQKKAALDAQYEKDLLTLRKEFSGAELAQMEVNLKARYDAEVTYLKDALITESDLYRQLNQDIIGFTEERFKTEIASLKAQLKKGTFTDKDGIIKPIPPELRRQVEEYIRKLEQAYAATKKLFGATASDFEKWAGNFRQIQGMFSELAGSVEGLNAGLADTLSTLSDLSGIAANAASAIAKFATGDILGGIGAAVSAIAGVFQIGAKVRESERKTREEIAAFQAKQLAGEIDITQQYRERQREQQKLNQLKLQGLQDEKKLLADQKKAVQDQYNTILAQLQQQSYVAGLRAEKYGGFLGIGRKTRAVEIAQTLAGKTFDELEQLFAKGQLTGKAKELFEILQKLREEGADIDRMLDENKRAAQELFTGTTADSIVDTIADGFRNGLRSAADFADSFEDLMRNAMINALKFRFLEGPINDLFNQFADFAESGSGLTTTEISALQQMYQDIIENAGKQFDQLQQIAGINFNSLAGSGNALTGAIKGITEQTAEVLAGQFGGLRITAVQQLDVAMQALRVHQRIEANTADTVAAIKDQTNKMFYWFITQGIKIA